MIVMLVPTAALLAPQTSPQLRPPVHQMTFTSTDGAFQFSYPSNFQVCTAGKIESCVHAYISACEQDAIVCAVYPAKQFKGTNFGAAAFQVREIHTEREMMTPDVCATPYSKGTSAGVSEVPEFLISAQHPTEAIGGVLFVHGITGGAALSNSSSVDLYRAFHQKKCFELSLSESETEPHVSDPPLKTLTHVQQKDLDESLTRVLHSFRFLK
jgi:hypothetical protein